MSNLQNKILRWMVAFAKAQEKKSGSFFNEKTITQIKNGNLHFFESYFDKRKNFDWDYIEHTIDYCHKNACEIISMADDRYPELLSEIYSPPIILFVQGDVSVLKMLQISIVGSRNCTPYGEKITEFFVSQLVEYGLVITSGMAIGIDGIAHKTTILCSGKTVAVLGSGMQSIYPRTHIDLYKDILYSGGAVISEFFPDTAPFKYNFPKRNRIISGLSLGTLVSEASRASGSLITAKYALMQNREVFAVPGSIIAQSSVGTNYLIQKGAKLVMDIKDILDELEYIPTIKKKRQQFRFNKIKDIKNLNDPQKSILLLIENTPSAIENLFAETDLTQEEIYTEITDLELKGFVVCRSGIYYSTLI